MPFSICALDDDESALYTLAAMAQTQGWWFKGTGDIEECLAWVRDGGIDILLLDYHMPLQNGLDVLRRVKAIDLSQAVLMLTVEQDAVTAENLLLAGAEDFINKPVRLADFLSRVRLHQRLHERERDMRVEMRKGISPDKLQLIVGFLKDKAAGVEIEQLSEKCGLSYTTAHRYLDYLVKSGHAATSEVQQDGKLGRPARLYRFVGLEARGEK